MSLQQKINLGLCLLAFNACQAPEQPALLQENSTTRLVEVAPVWSPEEQALMNKIANRTLLQEVIDQAPQEQMQSIELACSAQMGGVVTYIQKEQELRGIRLSISQEKAGRSTRWYYQNKNTVLVAHEQSQWQGNQEHLEQTVFYVDQQELLQVLHRVVTTAPERLETALEKAPFEQVAAPTQQELWLQLQAEEEQLLTTPSQKRYTSYFCP